MIIRARITDKKQGTAILTVQERSVWACQFSEEQLKSITKTIVGKSLQQATTMLLQLQWMS